MNFPRSSSQNKYLIVFQDLFTKWIELKPIRAATGKAVSTAFEELILFRWNTPTYVLNDNGPEFKNECWQNTLKKYHIRRIKIPAYYPKGNPVERANETLKTMISTFVEENHRSWDKHLHELRYAMNTATQASTRHSPYLLNFGRHPEPLTNLRRESENRESIIYDYRGTMVGETQQTRCSERLSS